jgi:crescentin
MSDPRHLLSNFFAPRRSDVAPLDPEPEIRMPRVAEEPAAPPSPAPAAPAPVDSLQSIGRDAEELRERVAHIGSRLDDLQSIRDDFERLSAPLETFISEFSGSKRKIAEMNAVLAREEELLHSSRSDLVTAERSATQLTHEMRLMSGKLQEKEALSEQSQATIEHYRALLEEKTAVHNSIDRELFSSNERLRSLSIENNGLKQELSALTRSSDSQSRQLREVLERSEIQGDENARLLQTVEALSARTTDLQSRLEDVTQKLHSEQKELSILQAKLLAEHQGAQKANESRDADRSSFQKEISSLQLRVETTANRLAATEKLLAHVRSQSTEQTEVFREAEKIAKDAVAARIEAERALSLSQETQSRQTSALQEAQQLINDLRDKYEALSKTAAAKDVLVETSSAKAASLEARLEQIMQRYESERASSETAFRRTLEELQNERAERLLLQGALDIARSGRSKLLSDISALKRKTAGSNPDPASKTTGEPGQIENGGSVLDNVRAFKTLDREDEKRAGSDRGGAWNGDPEEAVGARK